MMEQHASLIFFLFINFQVPEVICLAQLDSDQGREPQCRSQFDYEYKVVQKIVALENFCEGLKNTNKELRDEIQTTTNELRGVIQTNNELRAEIQTTTNEIQYLKSKISEGPKVAFLAVLEKSVSVSAGSTIIFDSIVTNLGNGYNEDTGTFVAQYNGIYQFAATVMTKQDGEIWSYFSLNRKTIAYIYAHASDRRHDQGANTIILQLNKGDAVSVVNKYTSTLYGGRYTSFSGTLL